MVMPRGRTAVPLDRSPRTSPRNTIKWRAERNLDMPPNSTASSPSLPQGRPRSHDKRPSNDSYRRSTALELAGIQTRNLTHVSEMDAYVTRIYVQGIAEETSRSRKPPRFVKPSERVFLHSHACMNLSAPSDRWSSYKLRPSSRIGDRFVSAKRAAKSQYPIVDLHQMSNRLP